MSTRLFLVGLIALGCVTVGCKGGSRPTDQVLSACVMTNDIGATRRWSLAVNRNDVSEPNVITKIEWGKPFDSQGGFTDVAIGAPKGTRIWIAKVHFENNNKAYLIPGNPTPEVWVFTDSFDKLKCVERPH